MQAKIGELRNRLSYYLRRVAAGEIIEVLDRDRPVARISPIQAGQSDGESWAARLREAGLAQGGPQSGSRRILEESPPGPPSSGVLEELLAERKEGR
jgi:antitoxin (DNA-binding transcriptional repressor) of toxin-antitoxin stability system